MSYRHNLLAGTSALALVLGAGAAPASAQVVGNFVFGNSSAVVTASVATPGVTTATAGVLSSQVNNNLGLSAVVEANQAITATGATVTGGPSTSSLNIMSATAIANQFSSNMPGAITPYVVDPTFAPAGGNATLGTSQLNYNSNATDGTARLGLLGGLSTTTTTITPAVSASTGTFTNKVGTNLGISFDIVGTTWTVSASQTLTNTGLVVGDTFTELAGVLTGTSGVYNGLTLNNYNSTPVVVGSTSTKSVFAATSSSTGAGAGGGSLNFVQKSAPYTPAVAAVTSSTTTTIGGTGNAVTFTAGAAYGAPVTLDGNQFAARINGNLALSSIAGGVATGGFSAGTASLTIDSTGPILAPVGTSIIVNAPVSLSNVQQNITDNVSATNLNASTANTVVSALFAGTTPGFNGGPVSVSTNAVTASAAGNSATVGVNLTAANIPTLGSGVAVVTAQGNNASVNGTGTVSTLTVAATNSNTTMRIMAQDSSASLTQLSNSTAALSGNTISSRTSLNEVTAQTLNTAATLAAGGTMGTSANSQLISPTSTLVSGRGSDGTVSVAGDYLNVVVQNNIGAAAGFTSPGTGSVVGNATVDNAVIGFFGGVTNGSVTVQGNAISGTAQGNIASVSTVMPLISGAATTLTGIAQSNADVGLNATVSGTQIRISDSSALLFGTAQNMDVSSATSSTVASASGATFTSATLNIGTADRTLAASLGNTVRSTVFGNSGTASANLGQTTTGSTNAQVTSLGSTGSTAATPTGTQVESAAPTSVIVSQQNLGMAATAQVTHPLAASGNGLFQIDAYQGLSTATATIGNNTLRSTAVGNFADAAATVYGATGNTLAGGVAVGTFQGNGDSSVNAFLGAAPIITSGPSASIGVGAMTASTAQVLNNTFAATAVGNSATGSLTIPAGNILGGTVGTSTPQYTNAASVTGAQTGSYVVGNAQVNAGTSVGASTLNAATYNDVLTGASSDPTSSNPFSIAALAMISTGTLSSRLNVGAASFTNSQALVVSNTTATTAVGNEYVATVSGFVTPAGTFTAAVVSNPTATPPVVSSPSSTTYTSLSVANTQMNIPNDAGVSNSTVTSANIGSAFIVSTASSNAAATGGASNNTGGIADTSTLSVLGNTASAAATGNSARLSVTGIGTSNSGANTFVADVTATEGGTQASTAPVAITNRQINTYLSVANNTPAILAGTGAHDFGVNVGTSSSTTNSTLQVNTNAMTAAATANTADLSATLGTSPAFVGGIGLNNFQSSTGAVNTASGSTSTSVQAVASLGFFNVGTGVPDLSGTTGTISYVDNSTVSVTGNRMAATATQNAATLSVTAPSTTLVQGPGAAATANATASATGSTASVVANLATVNVQAINGMDSNALAGLGLFTATADAINSTVNVNGNRVDSAALGNTATATLAAPRIDGTMAGFNAQSASNAQINAATFGVGMVALTNGPGATTEQTPVSVSGNYATAQSTVNNYAATMSGLGQTSAGNITRANSTVSVAAGAATVTNSTGTLTLGNSQLISGGTSGAMVTLANFQANLANSATTSSPITVDGNYATATASGNISAQTILANGAGASDSRGGMGNYSAQGFGVAGPNTNSVVSGTVQGVNIGATLAAETTATVAGNVMSGSPVSVSGNFVTASATANSATLITAFNGALRSTGSGSVSTATEASSGLSTTVVADYSLANVQSMTGSLLFGASPTTTRAIADVSGVSIGTSLTNSSTTASGLNVSTNTVTASANGNVSALSMIGNVSGAAGLGGTAVSSNQVMNTSLVSATNTGTSIGAQMVGGVATGSYMLTNSPVTINGNTVGSAASGNSSSLNSGFASANRYNGSGSYGTASTAAASGSNSYGDYVLLNTQRATGSTVAASTMGTTINYAGAASNGPVSLQGNIVYATAFGNSASMAISGAQAGGSMQSTNYQQTSGSTVSASVTGTNIAASMASAASTSAPISVSGNAIRAVAVGNSVTNAVGR